MSELDEVLDEGSASSTGVASLKPIAERANFAKIMMYIMAGLVILVSISEFYTRSVLQSWMDGEATLDDIESADGINGMVTVLYFLAFIIAVVAWCRWKIRAMENVHNYGLKGLSISPGWAAGWYFIPIAFWWMPYKAMTDIFKGSQAIQKNDPSSWSTKYESKLVGIWWSLWVIGAFVGAYINQKYSTALDEGDIEAAISLLGQSSLLGLISAACAVVAAQIVVKVVEFQTQPDSMSSSDSLDG